MREATALSLEEARENYDEEKKGLLVESEDGEGEGEELLREARDALSEESVNKEEDDDEELLRQAIALSLEDWK